MWPNTVRKEDVKIIWKSGTVGGQNVNKNKKWCHITHIPTGITASGTEHRDRPSNLKLAWKRLTEKLVPLMKQEVIRQRYEAGTERIRTYHEPQDRVTDHRTGKSYNYKDVLEGNLDKIIQDIKQGEIENG